MHSVDLDQPAMNTVDSYDDVDHKHNNWDLVRISKKNVCTMRCRHCQLQVKMREIRRCVKFENGHCSRRGCKDMHVHKQKLKLRERVARHGTGVLEKVPTSLHPRSCRKAARNLAAAAVAAPCPVEAGQLPSPVASQDSDHSTFPLSISDEAQSEDVDISHTPGLQSPSSKPIIIIADNGDVEVQWVSPFVEPLGEDGTPVDDIVTDRYYNDDDTDSLPEDI
eukprot:TRINITY_DN23151_c0_g1_i1.p1 TRINITY_DN23151_c0_g1~~TRINITY_DN23151_c0_g1_i1.p1  ORF type:complete len:222 (+),score=47.02 TRINITY_DN23151_c0_g1_i1:52-717(+)